MKKRISIPIMVLIAFFTAVVSVESTYIFCATKKGFSQEGYMNDKLSYIDSIYRSEFVGDIDENRLTDYLIRGYLTGAGEKYGTYYNAEEYEQYKSSIEGNVVGIGVTVSYDAESELAKVISVSDGAPAEEAGIKTGDLIYKVNGKSCKELGYNAAVDEIKGEAGTKVSVTVLRGEKELTFDITRKSLVEQCVYYHMYDKSDIGVIRITRFATVAAEQFEDALNILKSKGAKKLVFDLRDNPGGDLNSVSDILDILLPEGDIVIATDKNGNSSVLKTSDANETDMPMAVLVNGNSASASELFAANIRDYNKGAIIGETTYGKGTMQNVIPLPDGSCVVVSYRMFASKNGVNYEGVGIEPDIAVEPNDSLKNGSIFEIKDKDDNQLMKAVEYLTK